ncbi:hypothetical protein [Streptomyces sp. NPDC046976]|uniref:hypothetical protein n=1 Tax=Streptomyces sp. NPDC046976 TaxID=3155258 RepID=UPI0033DF5F8D
MDSKPGPERPQRTVQVTVTGVAEALEDIGRLRASVLFAWHNDLVVLDDELDILYRGQI